MAFEVSMKDMLESGAHFGHQTRRWNPKMRPYIYGAKNGIHVINLQKTYPLFKKAMEFLTKVVSKGEQVMFVGTKHQAREVVTEEANRCDMPYVTYRWLGGMLTNIATIRKSLQTIEDLDTLLAEGSVERLPKKEVLRLEKRREKLLRNLEGIRNMNGLPKAIFIIDPMREKIAVAESTKLKIPTVAVVDTNCDPDTVQYAIPANDDAIKSIRLFARAAADACLEGRELHKQILIAGTDKATPAGDEADSDVEVIVRGKGPRKGKKAKAKVEEAPAAEAAAEETAAEEVPAEEVPAEAAPAEEVAAEAAPAEEVAAEAAPAEEVAAKKAPAKKAPAKKASAKEAPAEEAPAEKAPAEEVAAEAAPAEETPAEEVAAEEAPAEEAPAEKEAEKE